MSNRSDPRHRLSLLTAVVLILGSCSDGTSFPGHQDPIELAVRMHLVQSDQLEELNVGLSNAEVTELLAAVNEIWAQAAVVWSLESIVRENARNESLFQSALTDPDVSLGSVLTSVLPVENLRDDVWNVFMIRNFGELRGVYLANERVVVSAEINPNGQRDIDGDMSRTLAHELGHSLGLFHFECEGQGNLMAPECLLGTPTRLDASQIADARFWAALGRPF